MTDSHPSTDPEHRGQTPGEPVAGEPAPAPAGTPDGVPGGTDGVRGGAPEAAGGRPEPQDGFGDAAGRAPEEVEAEPTGSEEVDDLAAAEAEMARARDDVAALTLDLQRLQAEYVNYKRRVDRDRQLIAENATFKALTPVVEVLDTIDRAREAGELEGGFKAVAEQLERAAGSAGLTRFGEPGDPFDPTHHEALSHLGEEEGVEVTTVKMVAKAGYRIGDRVVRAAQVLVVDPATAGE